MNPEILQLLTETTKFMQRILDKNYFDNDYTRTAYRIREKCKELSGKT